MFLKEKSFIIQDNKGNQWIDRYKTLMVSTKK